MNSIFPKEIIEHTIELHRHKHLKKSNLIYALLLVVLLIVMAAIPFANIDIYTSSPGMIRPEKERNIITCPISGSVDSIYISDNLFVEKEDTLITIDASLIDHQIRITKSEIDTIKSFVNDLKYLLLKGPKLIDSIHTGLYKAEYQQCVQKNYNLDRRISQKYSAYKRQKLLFQKGVIARVEFQDSRFEMQVSKHNLNFNKGQQKNVWQNDLNQYNERLKILQTRIAEQEDQKKLYVIRATVAGNIQDLKGIEKGNFLYSGSSIAEISPSTNLVVECFVSPVDIGLLQTDHPVKFQIDAFHHNQWGAATGNVLNVSKDISIINKTPMFKVICTLNETSLYLSNKTPGSLKKGMTLTARFFVAKRSAYQLLFDKIEDWYDPI